MYILAIIFFSFGICWFFDIELGDDYKITQTVCHNESVAIFHGNIPYNFVWSNQDEYVVYLPNNCEIAYQIMANISSDLFVDCNLELINTATFFYTEHKIISLSDGSNFVQDINKSYIQNTYLITGTIKNITHEIKQFCEDKAVEEIQFKIPYSYGINPNENKSDYSGNIRLSILKKEINQKWLEENCLCITPSCPERYYPDIANMSLCVKVSKYKIFPDYKQKGCSEYKCGDYKVAKL